jgi:integrase
MAVRSIVNGKHKKHPPKMNRDRLINIIESIIPGEYQLRNQALICFLYLTGCRIEEVVRYKKNYFSKGKIKYYQDPPILGEAIKRWQVEVKDFNVSKGDNDPEELVHIILVQDVRNLKRKGEFIGNRDIPITFSKQEMYFINKFWAYACTLDDNDDLFSISRQRVFKILEGLRLYPHWLRHIRLTHLVTDYGCDTEYLKQFTGWGTERTAKEYVNLDIKDLVRRMNK